MKKFILLLLFIPISLFSMDLDIHNIMKLEISDDIEIISVFQTLKQHNKSDQYCLRTNVHMIYGNKFLNFNIDLFGYGDEQKFKSLAQKVKAIDEKPYYPNYRTASQIDYLKNYYNEQSIQSERGLKYSLFFEEWASGVSSDYYGVFLK